MERESWLSGALKNFSPILMPAAHALVQAEKDVERAISDLSIKELWTRPNGAPSVGFHCLHIAGSIDRLLTYARGAQLNQLQFNFLKSETDANHNLDSTILLNLVRENIQKALQTIQETPESILFEKRTVGRLELPTNVFGLLFHIAEHTQRHVGQVVTTARIVHRAGENE